MLNKVLCVEDDAVTQMITKAIMKKESFTKEVLTALDGQEALNYYEALQSSSPNEMSDYPRLVLLDLNMPLMGGWEFLDVFMTRFLPKFEETRVVILTSSFDPKDKEKAKDYSIVKGFLSKPFSPEMLGNLKFTE